MRIEALALQLRPRSMSEAADLGVRLVQANAGSVWVSFTPVWAVVAVVAMASLAIVPWMPMLALFWLKPWLDRTLLFVLSRAVFGTPTRLADVWEAQRPVWWRQLLSTLTLQRLYPSRAYLLPARQLEGQRGKAWRARSKQLLQGHHGAAWGMHFAFAQLESLLLTAAVIVAFWFLPGDPLNSIVQLVLRGDPNATAGTSNAWSAGLYAAYAVIVLLVEPFYVGAGFAMYLNRRVELEAWDIEQEFRLAFGA